MLDLAIIGAGAMGANHARVAMGLRDARVTLIVDPDRDRGTALADKVGGSWEPDIERVFGRADAAVLAVPTHLHRDIGTVLLGKGISLLVEKPISRRLDEAADLIEAAATTGVTLMVGHIERFNPAVMEVVDIATEPVHIETQRISPYTPRISDGVILDLMIHDLDIVAAIARSPVTGIDAVATRTRSASEDLAVALLTFENSVTATLTASRIGQQKIRSLNVTRPDTYVAADLIRQSVTIHRVEEVGFSTRGGSGYRQTGVVEIPFLQHQGEPLYLELQHFVECVLSGSRPVVAGEQGRDALRLALDVMRTAGVGIPS